MNEFFRKSFIENYFYHYHYAWSCQVPTL
jgi:hypothetical protein